MSPSASEFDAKSLSHVSEPEIVGAREERKSVQVSSYDEESEYESEVASQSGRTPNNEEEVRAPKEVKRMSSSGGPKET